MRDGPDPVVSVVVLTYDRPARLERCLESLVAQDCAEPFEIVVADDGSGARTREVVRRIAARDQRVRYHRQEHAGIAATRNLGVRESRGGLVAIVADDYVLAPDYLSTATRYLTDHPDAAVVRFDVLPLRRTIGAKISNCYYAASIDRRLESEGLTPERARHGTVTHTLEAAGAAVFRREVLAAIGPWDVELQRGEDTEHTARLRDAGFDVHVLACGTVRHDYDRVPLDTLRKAFLVGRWRPVVDRWSQPRSVSGKVRTLGRALDRSRRGGESSVAVALYLPWMVLFEVAIGVGHVTAILRPPDVATPIGAGSRARRRGMRSRTAARRGPDPALRTVGDERCDRQVGSS
jgi:glycosyltransferase involved in cell wall biosynthesis